MRIKKGFGLFRAFCLVGAFVFHANPLLANECLTPPSIGLEWYPQSTALRVGSPGEPPYVQVGGHVTPGYQILLDGVAMTPDAQGFFGIVFAAPSEPTRYEWTLIDATGRTKKQAFTTSWRQPFPGFSGQAIPPGLYQLPDYLSFSCDAGASLDAQPPSWAPFFSINLLYLSADGGRNSFSPAVGWMPRVELLPSLDWVSNLSFSLVRYDSERIYPFVELRSALRYHVYQPFSVEMGIGAHLIAGTEPINLNWSAGVVYSLEEPLWGFSEFFASYGGYPTSIGNLTGMKIGTVWTF
jgi:hypothetical protein